MVSDQPLDQFLLGVRPLMQPDEGAILSQNEDLGDGVLTRYCVHPP